MAGGSKWMGRFGSRVLVAALVASSAGWFLPTSAGAVDICNGQWNPVVRSVTVNQGLGTYTQLTRGKTTLVRLFISEPSCAPSGSEKLVNATLTAVDGATTLASTGGTAPATAANLIPTIQGPNYPVIDSYSSAPTANGTGNPIFQLPGFGTNDPTTQAPTPTPFTASFYGTVTYQYQALTGGAWTQATATIGSAIQPVATATVAPPSNSLRVLVVPMGDASAAIAQQFPEARNGGTAVNGEYADTVVQNSMQTLSRLMPVPDGVGDLAAGSGGLLYRLDDAAMIDLGPNGLAEMDTSSTSAQWCGGSGNFTTDPNSANNPYVSVSYQLGAALNAWNGAIDPSTGKPLNPHADRVVGAIWQGVSQGVTPNGCAEGYASVTAPQAWMRLFVDQTVVTTNALGQKTYTSDPSETGALIGMEISHTWGSVPLSDARDTNHDYHSGNVTADPTSTQRGYNVALAQWMSSPVSDMHYSGDSSGYTAPTTGKASSWNNSTALYEQQDYLFNQCELTAGLQNCPATTQPGSVGSAAAGATALYLAGTSDGTQAGTNVHSYYTASAQTSPPDITSAVNLFDAHLIQRDASGNVLPAPYGDQHVPVRIVNSDHDGDSGAAVKVTTGTIDSVMPIDPNNAVSFEIWNGEPPTGATCTASNMPAACLYVRTKGTAPIVSSHNSSAELANLNAFATAPALTKPAISPDGKFVAWVGSAGIVVQARNATTNQPTGAPSAALSGAEPAWSPDGSSIAFTVPTNDGSADIDTATVNSTANPPTFGTPQVVYNHLLQTPPALGSTAASHASYSPDGKWLAVAINSDVWKIQNSTSAANPVVCDLSTLTPTNTCVPLDTSGSDSAPAWGAVGGTPAGAGLVAFDRGSDIWSVDPNSTPAAPVKRIAGASAPAWGSSQVAFVQSGTIWTADTSAPASDGSWTLTNQLTGSGSGGGSDSWPSLTSNASAIAFDRPGSSNHQVMVGTIDNHNPTIQFTVSTTGDPSLIRADMYLTCAGAYEPIFFGLKPTSTSSGSSLNYANFSVSYSDSRACPGGTIYAQATNGWLRSALTPIRTIPGQLSGGATTTPDPAIGAPLPGTTYLQYDPIIALGSSVDQSSGTNGSGVSLQWTLTGPSGSGYNNTSVGSGTPIYIGAPIPDANAPGGGGWVPGSYTLCVTATNGATHQTGKSCVTYTVLPDPAHLGANVTEAFNPQTLYVPSSGNDVTITITPNGQNLSKINPASVQIVQVGGYQTAIGVDTSSGTTGWVSNGNGSYTAKFNRSTLSCLMAKNGLVNFYVPVVVSGSSTDGSVTFYGFDPKYPVASPSGTSCSC